MRSASRCMKKWWCEPCLVISTRPAIRLRPVTSCRRGRLRVIGRLVRQRTVQKCAPDNRAEADPGDAATPLGSAQTDHGSDPQLAQGGGADINAEYTFTLPSEKESIHQALPLFALAFQVRVAFAPVIFQECRQLSMG